MNAAGGAGYTSGAASDLSVGAESNVGRREDNQDRMARFDSPVGEVFLVADGMGGHLGGATASAAVTDGFRAYLQATPAGTPLDTAILQAAARINFEIYERGHGGDPSVAGMGSTLVMAVLAGDQLVIAHCGDSRAYLLTGGTLRRLTVDHTALQRLVDAGLVSEDEARDHPDSNVLARAFGQQTEVLVDISGPFVPQPGDRLMLCSDGLSGYATDPEIADVMMAAPDPRQCTQSLLALAFRNESDDNVTVQVVQFGRAPVAVRPVAAIPAASPVARRMQARAEDSERPQGGGLWRIAVAALAGAALAVGGFMAWRHFNEPPKTTPPTKQSSPAPPVTPPVDNRTKPLESPGTPVRTPPGPPSPEGGAKKTPAEPAVDEAKPEVKKAVTPPSREHGPAAPTDKKTEAPKPADSTKPKTGGAGVTTDPSKKGRILDPKSQSPATREELERLRNKDKKDTKPPQPSPSSSSTGPATICIRASTRDQRLFDLVDESVRRYPQLARSRIKWFPSPGRIRGETMALILYQPRMEVQAEMLRRVLERQLSQVDSREVRGREAYTLGECQIQVGFEPYRRGRNGYNGY